MNGEILWNAIGNVSDELIAETAAPPAKTRRSPKIIFLAAAIILLLSACTYAAVKWLVSFEDIFGSEKNELVEDYEQPLGSAVGSEGISFTAVSALADERIFYLLWQLDGGETKLPENAAFFPTPYFSEGTINNGLGYFNAQMYLDEAENALTGYLISSWNGDMQNAKGNLSSGEICVPVEVPSEDFSVDFQAVIAKSEYVNGEYESGPYFFHKYYPEYQWLDVLAYDETYIDLAVYEDGILTVVTRREQGTRVSEKKDPTLYVGDEIAEVLAANTFVDKNGYNFTMTDYRIDEEDIPNLIYRRNGKGHAYKTWKTGMWILDFDISPTMESVMLETDDPNIKISCSKISMSISGDLPKSGDLKITLKNGEEVQLIDHDPACAIFLQPQEPSEIASVLYNGKKLLG